MNITPRCILQLKHYYPELSGKFRVIADYILACPEKIITQKVMDIARACGCDAALVTRLCKKIGYSGFAELKMSISMDFMPVRPDLTDKDFSADDSFSQLSRNFLENNVRVLSDSMSLLKSEDVDLAVKLLSEAEKIYLLACGVSGIVTSDIHIKLLQMGFNSVFSQDSEFLKLLTGLCGKDDVVLAVSFSGETAVVCDTAAMAKKAGAPVISVTNFSNSSIAGMSDVAFLTASDEKVFRLGAMTSRISQYFLLDFIIVSMALRNMERFEESIMKKHKMVKGKKSGRRGR